MNEKKEWYVVNTITGHEYKVKEKLEMRINNMELQNTIFRVIIPEQKEIEIKDGKKKEKIKKMFPGYVLVEMIMTDEAWYVVRNTPGVTGFIGSSGGGAKPFPVSPEEIESILQRIGESDKKIVVDFQVGDQVRILSGPYQGQDGAVESMDDETESAKVLVVFASQQIPAEVSYVDLERI